MVVDYAKQETLGPLQNLLRFVGWGAAGSVFLSFGLALLLLALLRLLQGETGAFHGNLSWVPYLITAVVALALIGLSAWRITQGPARRVGADRSSGRNR